MRRVRRTVFLAALVTAGLVIGAVGYPALAASASSPIGTWGSAVNLPGTSAELGGAEVTGVSCAPGGECTAVGGGLASTGSAFAIAEKNGAWGRTIPIPGASKLGEFGGQATSVSCPATGDCLVVGTAGSEAWYAQETGGHWSNATYIPGLKSLSSSAFFLLSEIASCSSPGNCAVAGDYFTDDATSLTGTVFVTSESAGHWKPAVTTMAGLPDPTDSLPELTTLSCASAGNCVLGGGVISGTGSSAGSSVREAARELASGDLRSARSLLARNAVRPAAGSDSPTVAVAPFVASEVSGNWQGAVQPSLGTSAPLAVVTSAACPSGDEDGCIVAGVYATSETASEPGGSFLLSPQGTTWSTPATNSTLAISSLACPTAGNCTGAGSDVHGVAAVARESNGTWGSTTDLPSAKSMSYKGKKASSSEVEGLACPSAGNCSVVGTYTTGNASSPTDTEGFVGREANGAWSPVHVPASLTSLNSGGEATYSGETGVNGALACASAANCAAGGSYGTNKYGTGAFIQAEVPIRATATTLKRSHSIVTYGREQFERLSVAVTAKSGTPGGTVTVMAGTKAVCTITLKSGQGSCALSKKQFRPGHYHLVADYHAGWPYGDSASSSWPLTVNS